MGRWEGKRRRGGRELRWGYVGMGVEMWKGYSSRDACSCGTGCELLLITSVGGVKQGS